MATGLLRALSRTRAGYSLLEVIVVVAILGVAATLSGPSIARMISAQQAQQVVRGLATEFGAIRSDAFIGSVAYDADALRQRLSDAAPQGWVVDVEESVSLSASGYCSPGLVQIISPAGRSWALFVAEGDCALGSAP
jgi:prepilin-type N-terminal cleavage/methylation domain-containing protein